MSLGRCNVVRAKRQWEDNSKGKILQALKKQTKTKHKQSNKVFSVLIYSPTSNTYRYCVNPCLLHSVAHDQVPAGDMHFSVQPIYDLPSLATVDITESREPYYLLTRMSTVSNSLLAFLRDTFGTELKNCIRNLLILIFRETKRAPRRPPSIPRRMVGMKAKTLMSSKFLTWVKERRKKKKMFWASCQ